MSRLLRTVAGAYAGEVREYSSTAAAAALASGTAVAVDMPPAEPIQKVADDRPTIRSDRPAARRNRR